MTKGAVCGSLIRKNTPSSYEGGVFCRPRQSSSAWCAWESQWTPSSIFS